jgi:hypothetical protein
LTTDSVLELSRKRKVTDSSIVVPIAMTANSGSGEAFTSKPFQLNPSLVAKIRKEESEIAPSSSKRPRLLMVEQPLSMNSASSDEFHDDDEAVLYRDRAEERRRREKDDAIEAEVLATRHPSAAVTEGIGGLMLKKLGWSEGSGLGKDEGGIVEPIQVKANSHAQGLGV